MEDDARLMQRVRMRDALAFEVIYIRHHRLVYAIAMRFLRDAYSADDVTQSVFLKIWSAPNAFENGNFAAWIGRLARNKCIDALRTAARHTAHIPLDALGEQVRDSQATLAESDDVEFALARIPSERRTLIELAYFGGMTHRHIAQKTGVPLGTVKTRIRKGLAQIREALIEFNLCS